MLTDVEIQDLTDNWHLAHMLYVPAGATVVVAGAYRGKVMEYMLRTFPSIGQIHGYEPQIWAAKEAKAAVSAWPNAYVHPYALGSKTAASQPMGEFNTDGCSFLGGQRDQGVGDLNDVYHEFNQEYFKPNGIDLAIFNMEGYEYVLVPYMLDHLFSGQGQPRSLAIQFHQQFTVPSKHHKLINTLNRYYVHSYTQAIPQWGYWSDWSIV